MIDGGNGFLENLTTNSQVIKHHNILVRRFLRLNLCIENHEQFLNYMEKGFLDLQIIDKTKQNCIELTISFENMMHNLQIDIIRGISYFVNVLESNGQAGKYKYISQYFLKT